MKQKGANPKNFKGILMKKVEYMSVSPNNTKASNSKDNTKEASMYRQLKMEAKVVSTFKWVMMGILC